MSNYKYRVVRYDDTYALFDVEHDNEGNAIARAHERPIILEHSLPELRQVLKDMLRGSNEPLLENDEVKTWKQQHKERSKNFKL